MKGKVYIETSTVSYYAGAPHRDIVIAARQELTREYWSRIVSDFECYISVLVLQESERGDQDAASQRLKAIEPMSVLEIDGDAEKLAEGLMKKGAVPEKCPEDALHIALAATNGMEYLLTWNFKHINNAQMKGKVIKVVEDYGYECPVFCSPDELVGE
jgi:hypothetical protein